MNYLFFDIECANCFGGDGKICSFGYCLTDEHFQLLEKQDIIINPAAAFNLRGKDADSGIQLAYTRGQFRKAPRFDYYYETLRSLLEAPDQIVVGHAVENDVHFVCSDCRRYHKPCISYAFLDSQRLYAKYKNENRQVSLEKIIAEFGLSVGRVHQSDEDAFMTMQIVRELCNRMGLTLSEAAALYPDITGRVHDFDIERTEQDENVLFRAYLKTLSTRHVYRLKGVNNKCFCFSRNLVSRMPKHVRALARRITDSGGCFTNKNSNLHYFVRDELPCDKLAGVEQYNRERTLIKIITIDELYALLAVTPDQLDLHDYDRLTVKHVAPPAPRPAPAGR